MSKQIAEQKKKKKNEQTGQVGQSVSTSLNKVKDTTQKYKNDTARKTQQRKKVGADTAVTRAANTVAQKTSRSKKAVEKSTQQYQNRVNKAATTTANTSRDVERAAHKTIAPHAAPKSTASRVTDVAKVAGAVTNQNADIRAGELQRLKNIEADRKAEQDAQKDIYNVGKGKWTGEWTNDEIEVGKRGRKRLETVVKNTPKEILNSYDIALTQDMSDEEREYMRQFLSDEDLQRIDYYNDKRLEKRMKRRDELQAETNEAIQGAESNLERWILQGVQSGEGMAMDQAFNVLLPGAWTVSMGARTMGSQRGVRMKEVNDSLYKSAIENGMSEEDAADYVARVGMTEQEDFNYIKAQAAKEIFTEYIFQGYGIGKQLTGGKSLISPERLMKILPQNILGRAVGGGLEESAEEWIGMMLDPYTEEYSYDRNIRKRQAQYTLEKQLDQYRAMMADPQSAQSVSLILNDPRFIEQQKNSYKKMGFDDEKSEYLAEQTREYITADITGDTAKRDAIEKVLSRDISDINGLKFEDVNPISKKNFGEFVDTTMSTFLLTMATGLPSAFTTSEIGRSIRDSDGGREQITKWTGDILKGSTDAETASKVQAMNDRMESGKALTGTQVFDLSQMWAEDTQERQEEANTSNDTAQNTIRSEGLEQASMLTINDRGEAQVVHNPATNEAVTNKTAEAFEIVKETRGVTEEDASAEDVQDAQTMGRFLESGMVTASDSRIVDYGNVEGRQLYERMTGEDLSQYDVYKDGKLDIPATNKALRSMFYAKAAQNQIVAARRETEFRKDQIDGEIKEVLRPSMAANGNAALTEALQSIDSRDWRKTELVSNAFGRFYRIGKDTTMTKEEALRMYRHLDVDRSILDSAYDAGANDYIEGNTPANNQVVQAGAETTTTSRKAIVRGQFTTDFKNGTQISGSLMSVFEGLAKALNLNIVLTDDLHTLARDAKGNIVERQINGASSGSTRTITLNVHSGAEQNLSYTLMHELTHQIRTYAPKEYQILEDLIFEKWLKMDPAEAQRQIDYIVQTYKDAKKPLESEAQAREEIVCNAMAEAINDKKFIDMVCSTNTNLGRSVLNAIRSSLRSLRNLFLDQQYHTRRDEAYHNALLSRLGILDEAERLWLDALAASYQAQAQNAFNNWNQDAVQERPNVKEQQSITPQMDADYMSAVESGDMETAQRMVDEAAEKAGYVTAAYHGTDAENEYTVFDTISLSEFGSHFGTEQAAKEINAKYGNGKINKVFLDLGNSLEMPDIFGEAFSLHDYVTFINENDFDDFDAWEENNNMWEYDRWFDEYFNTPKELPENEAFQEMRSIVEEAKEADNMGPELSEALSSLSQKYMKSLGYDSVTYVNNVEDFGSKSYIVFDPEQIKSADPVTYDDKGNVIPLSERFNTENQDIRYSLPATDSDDELGISRNEEVAQMQHDYGPDVRFSYPTYAQVQPKAIFKSGKGFSEYYMDSSGKQLTYDLYANNFSEKQARAVTQFLDLMGAITERTGEGSLQYDYRFVGWDDLTEASVKVKRNEANEIVGVTVSAMVKNGEYPVNFDLSTVCNKREGVLDVIKNLMNTKVSGTNESVLNSIKLTDENMWKINKALKAEGIDTACLGCFVEARRYYAQNFMNKIDDKWNSAVKKARKELGLPEAAYFDFANGRQITGEEWSSIDELWTKYDESTESKSSPAERIKILMDEIVKNKDVNSPYLKLIRMSDILTPEGINGFKQLSNKGHDLVKTIKSIYGTSAPKEIMAFTPYNSEIALLPDQMKGMPTSEYLKSIGGIRVQSFSDFKIAHFFDHMQMVADEAARGFVTHGYAKVIAFPRIFGLTGRKLNMSVMFDVLSNKDWATALGISVSKARKYAKMYQGLQFVKELPAENIDNRPYKEVTIEGVHGYLTYLVSDADYVNSVFEREYQKNLAAGMDEDKARREANKVKPFEQSINYREAVELENRDGYKENVGIIAVAYGDEHLKMLLEDPNVRYIIPYHKSGLPTFISKQTSLAIARDFTDYQNTNIAKAWHTKSGATVDIKAEYEEFKNRDDIKNEPYPAILFFEYLNNNGYKVTFGKKTTAEKAEMAGTADFDVYEPLEKAKDVREVSNGYLEHCLEKGWVPVFHEFAGNQNYYKMIFDFAVTDGTTTNIYPQRPVKNRYPGIDIDAKVEAGEEITEDDLTELINVIRQGAEEENTKNERRKMNMPNVMNDLLSRDSENSIIADTNIQAIQNGTPDYTNVKYGNEDAPQIGTEDSKLSITPQQDADYMDAVNRDDMEEAQRMVDEAAKRAGYYIDGYHGTDAYFDVFKRGDIGYHIGTKAQAESRISNVGLRSEQADRGEHIMHLYAKISSPLYAGMDFGDWHGKNTALSLLDTEQFITEDDYEEIEERLDEIGQMPNGAYTDKVMRQYLQSLGYDGIVYPNEFEDMSDDMDEYNSGDSYIVFESSQLKSADPVTYAEDGSVIPLSERFNPNNDDIRYSMPTTDSYGNVLSDDQMEYFKDSKARDEQGRLLKMYHGTENAGFTIFDSAYGISSPRFFFVNDLERAKGYSGTHDIFNPMAMQTLDELNDYIREIGYQDVAIQDGDEYVILEDSETEILRNSSLSDLALEYNEYTGWGGGAANYAVYLNVTNPLVIDAGGNNWDEVPYNGASYTTNELAEMALADGYDGLIVNNVVDYGMYASSVEREPQTDVIVFNSNQIKDTRNENPTENPDIRWSFTPENEIGNENVKDIEALPSDDPKIEEARSRVARSKENFFRSRNAKWKPDWKTEGRVLKESSVKKDIQDLIIGAMRNSTTTHQYRTGLVNEAMYAARQMYDCMKTDRVKDASKLAMDAADKIVENLEFIDDSTFERYKELKAYLKDNTVKIPQDIVAEFGDAESWNLFRKHNLNRIRMSTTEGIGIDTIYNDEMIVKFKDLFDPEITSPAEQIKAISTALDALKDYTYVLDEQDTIDLRDYIASQLFDIVAEGEEYKSSADKHSNKIDRLTKSFKQRLETAQEKARNEIDRLRESVKREQSAKERYGREAWLATERAEQAEQDVNALEEDVKRERQTKEAFGRELWQANERVEQAEQRAEVLEENVKRERKTKEKFGRELWKANERVEERKQKLIDYKQTQHEKKVRLKAYGHIYENYNWLCDRVLDPTVDKHVPEEFRRSLAEMLQLFDLQTERSKNLEAKTGKVAQKTFKMRELRSRLDDFAKTYEEKGNLESLDANMAAIADALADRLDGKSIDSLETADIINIDKLLSFTKHIMQNYNKVRILNKQVEISEIGGEFIKQMMELVAARGIASTYKGPKGAFDMLVNMEEVTPIYFFGKLGRMNDMYSQLRNVGFDKYIRNTKMISDHMQEILGKYYKTNKKGKDTKPGSELDSWRDMTHAQTFELKHGADADTITMSPAQIMSLYCLWQRQQAKQHILMGGIAVTPIQTNSKIEAAKEYLWKGNNDTNTSVLLNENDVKTILAALTPEQIKVAEQLQSFMANDMAALGNEAQMEMYGYKAFNDPNYFPIRSSDDVLIKDVNTIEQTIQKIKSFGPAKPLVPNANNKIVVDDIFSVVAEHCNGMNLYNAYLVPISDFMKMYNYKEGELNVRDALEKAYSKKALTYINNFMSDINGIKQSSRGGMDNLMNSALGKAKTAAVFGNVRVFLQQPTAIARALAVLDAKYFKGAAPSRKAMQEMFEHCPIAYWKSIGNYEMHMGRDIEDIMMNKWSVSDRLLSDWYGLADNRTWSSIWGAVKNEVKEKNPKVEVGSDEFWDLCNKRMSEVVDKTQVVDSAFHRSNMMRNKQLYAKVFTSFMAEPTLTFNVLRDGIVRAHEAKQNGDASKAGAIIGRTFAVLMLQQALVSVAQAIVDGWRGKRPKLPWEDDDDLLENMKKAQLLEYAAEHNIEIPPKAKKAEVLAAIQDAEHIPGLKGMLIRYADRVGRNTVYNFFESGRYWNNLYIVKEFTPFLDYAFTMVTEKNDSMFMKWFSYAMGWDQTYLQSPSNLLYSNWENAFKGFGKIVKESRNEEPEGNWYDRYYDPLQKFSSGVAAVTGLPFPTIMRDTKPIWDFIHENIEVEALDSLEPEKEVPTITPKQEKPKQVNAASIPNAKNKTDEKDASQSSGPSVQREVPNAGKQIEINKRVEKFNTLHEREQKALEKVNGITGEERTRKIYEAVTDGYTASVAEGDYGYLAEMRNILQRNGCDVTRFDNGVLKATKSEYKKTLTSEKDANGNYIMDTRKQSAMRQYMLSHGMTEADVSDLVYHSYMAKDLKAAFRLNNEEYIMNELVPLVHAGLTYEDFEKLYKYRNRFQNYDGKYKSEFKSSGKLTWPITGTITSGYGYRGDIGLGTNPMHYGIDIGANMGDPVGAADGGQVVFAGWNDGFGNQVVIRHDNGTETYYSHLSGFAVHQGDTVGKGQSVGQVGSTGQSTGPHLDFRVKVNGEYVNPMDYLSA